LRQVQQAVARVAPYNEWGTESKFTSRRYLVGEAAAPKLVRIPGPAFGWPLAGFDSPAEILGIDKGLNRLLRKNFYEKEISIIFQLIFIFYEI
jgi:hypothetical protein